MNKLIEDTRQIRTVVLDTISSLSVAQLNEIPDGFNNNIIWNLAHMTASQQGLSYFRSGLEMPAGQEYFQRYKADTKPQGPLSAEEIDDIKALFLSSIDQFKTDFNLEAFANYQSFTSRYGVEIGNITDALNFILFHDGLHYGYIMALKRVISKNI